MQVPLQITFHEVSHSDAMEERIKEAAAKLDQFVDDIISCRVAIEAHHRRQRSGNAYHIHITVTVPGTELVVSKEQGDRSGRADIYVAVRDGFDAMVRRLREHNRKKQGIVKADITSPHGKIVRLFPGEGYGFIEAPEGHEIYFHRNSVLNDAFDRLKVGAEVRYSEEEGEKGPQASTVEIVGREAKHDLMAHPAP
jgi:ribosomal subunit interface protein